jgi:hypothetical protein
VPETLEILLHSLTFNAKLIQSEQYKISNKIKHINQKEHSFSPVSPHFLWDIQACIYTYCSIPIIKCIFNVLFPQQLGILA